MGRLTTIGYTKAKSMPNYFIGFINNFQNCNKAVFKPHSLLFTFINRYQIDKVLSF
jgi:hypothetical protein